MISLHGEKEGKIQVILWPEMKVRSMTKIFCPAGNKVSSGAVDIPCGWPLGDRASEYSR